jgi:CheY-like chemotaxis protein
VGQIELPELKQEIKSSGLQILVVDNEEAIILAKTTDYDLALTDMAMPNVFGYDVIEALNKLEKRPKIGIITGWSEKLKPIDDGFKVDFIIKKPFDLTELSENINDMISTDGR